MYGTLAIMFPMISKLEELHRAKAVLKQCQEELRQEGIPFSQNIEVGMMVEVPLGRDHERPVCCRGGLFLHWDQ